MLKLNHGMACIIDTTWNKAWRHAGNQFVLSAVHTTEANLWHWFLTTNLCRTLQKCYSLPHHVGKVIHIELSKTMHPGVSHADNVTNLQYANLTLTVWYLSMAFWANEYWNVWCWQPKTSWTCQSQSHCLVHNQWLFKRMQTKIESYEQHNTPSTHQSQPHSRAFGQWLPEMFLGPAKHSAQSIHFHLDQSRIRTSQCRLTSVMLAPWHTSLNLTVWH